MSDNWLVSASKLKLYQDCQEQFRLRYVEGYEERGPPSRWIRRGNAVHDAVEDVLSDCSANDVTSDKLKRAYRGNGWKDGYVLSEDFHEQVLDSLETVAHYIGEHVGEIRGVECEIEYGIDRTNIDRNFGGFVDLMTDTSVVDWKTGKSEDKADKEALQGAVYMGGYAYEYGLLPDSVEFVYVNPDAGDEHPKVRSITPDSNLWNEMIQQAHQLLRSYQNDEYTADPGPSKCHWCDFEVHCGYSPVGVGNVPWGVYP